MTSHSERFDEGVGVLVFLVVVGGILYGTVQAFLSRPMLFLYIVGFVVGIPTLVYVLGYLSLDLRDDIAAWRKR